MLAPRVPSGHRLCVQHFVRLDFLRRLWLEQLRSPRPPSAAAFRRAVAVWTDLAAALARRGGAAAELRLSALLQQLFVDACALCALRSPGQALAPGLVAVAVGEWRVRVVETVAAARPAPMLGQRDAGRPWLPLSLDEPAGTAAGGTSHARSDAREACTCLCPHDLCGGEERAPSLCGDQDGGHGGAGGGSGGASASEETERIGGREHFPVAPWPALALAAAARATFSLHFPACVPCAACLGAGAALPGSVFGAGGCASGCWRCCGGVARKPASPLSLLPALASLDTAAAAATGGEAAAAAPRSLNGAAADWTAPSALPTALGAGSGAGCGVWAALRQARAHVRRTMTALVAAANAASH